MSAPLAVQRKGGISLPAAQESAVAPFSMGSSTRSGQSATVMWQKRRAFAGSCPGLCGTVVTGSVALRVDAPVRLCVPGSFRPVSGVLGSLFRTCRLWPVALGTPPAFHLLVVLRSLTHRVAPVWLEVFGDSFFHVFPFHPLRAVLLGDVAEPAFGALSSAVWEWAWEEVAVPEHRSALALPVSSHPGRRYLA